MIVGLGAAFYLVLGRGAKSTVTQQLLRRQQTIARAEASNITSFFQVFGDSMAVLAQLSSMERRGPETVQDMDAFVEQWRDSDLVGGVVLTDRNGVVRFNSNVLGTRDVGASLADRDYFVWAENQLGEGEYFIGQPVVSRLGASKGQTIVVVAAPVYQNGIFAGVVAASVKLQPLTERYLGLMKVSDATDVYLINEHGDLLYSSSASDAMGSNLFEHLQGLKNTLNTTEEGKLQVSYLDPKSGKPEEHLIAYSPITLGSQNWLIIMASPIQDITDLTAPIYIRIAAMLLLVSLTVLLFGVIVSRDNQIQKGLE